MWHFKLIVTLINYLYSFYILIFHVSGFVMYFYVLRLIAGCLDKSTMCINNNTCLHGSNVVVRRGGLLIKVENLAVVEITHIYHRANSTRCLDRFVVFQSHQACSANHHDGHRGRHICQGARIILELNCAMFTSRDRDCTKGGVPHLLNLSNIPQHQLETKYHPLQFLLHPLVISMRGLFFMMSVCW